MAIGFGAVGAKANGSDNAAMNVAYPASPGAGDLAIAFRNGWTAAMMTSFADEAGWTTLGARSGGTSAAADNHTCRVWAGWKELTGSESGSVSFDQTSGTASGNGYLGQMGRWTKASGDTWVAPTWCSGTDDTHGANRSATADDTTLDLQVGDVVVAVAATDIFSDTSPSSPAITASGITFGATTKRTTGNGTTIGHNGNLDVFDAVVTAGSGTVSPTLAFTTATSNCGPVIFIRLRATTPPAGVDLSIAGTIPQPVGSFSLTGFNDSEVSVAGVIPQPVGSFSLTGFNDSDVGVAGAIPLPVGDIDLTVTPTITELSVAGAIPLPVGAFSLTGFNDSDLSIAGTIPLPVGAVDLTVTPDLRIDGAIPLPEMAVSLTTEWICFDLSTAEFRGAPGDPEGSYVDGTIMGTDGVIGSGTGARFWFPSLAFGPGGLEYEETYEFQVTFTGESTWTVFDIETHADNTQESWEDGPWAWLSEGRGEEGPPPSTFTFTIGPGQFDWDTAADDEWTGLTFELSNQGAISELCYRLVPDDETPDMDIAGIIPLPYMAISLDSGEGLEDSPVETDTEVVDDPEVDQEQHEEDWHSPVAVVEPAEPLPVAYDVLRAYTSISLDGTQPVVVGAVTVRKPRLRDRILVDGVDVTFLNGIRTPTPDFSLIEPFTYGVCTLVLPQIFPLIQVLSAITWLRRGATVIIQRVDEEGNVVATDYRGRIMSWDISGDFTVSVGGMFSGPASVRWRPMPMVRRIEDVGYWLMTAFRHQRLPLVYEDFGVNLISRGENFYLDHCLELCSLGVRQNGSQITVHYDEDQMKFVAAPKDTTTIDATVYFDKGDMNPSLTRDFTAEVDEVFATAHVIDDDKQTRILNSVWPGMQQEDPIPAYPGVLEEGDDNEDVNVLIARLALLGYLTYAEKVGGFDDDVVDAILSARSDAEQLGTANDEALDEDLWDWLWDLGASGYTDREARILPMAQKRKVRQWNRSATGNRLEINPFYDPVYAALTVSQKLELGHVKSKNRAVRLARTLLDDGSDNWIGMLDTVMSFVRGEHTPGDPLTQADLMSGRELRPGMNLWAPLFQGGTLFHISSVDVSNDGGSVSLSLDTRSRDTMQVDGILERNRENRTSPARAFWNARSSSSASDTIFNHDEHFGKLGNNLELVDEGWLVYPIPAGDFGTVSQTIMTTFDPPAQFAMMVFQKKVTAEWVGARAPNPLNSADEWWADESVRADFKDRGIKYAAGSEEDPCGYFPGRKSRGHALTGRWEDEASFAFGGDSLVFWVAVYSDRASTLKRGNQFDVQRELGT